MNTITVTYTLEFRLKKHNHYQMTKCGKMFNVKSGRQIKKCSNNGSIGYWIGKKFLVISKGIKILEKIPKNNTLPF